MASSGPSIRGEATAPDADGRIDACLSVRQGHLFIEECDVVELARRFGTPTYVVSEDQLRRNARRFKDAFQRRWSEGTVDILPSLKANFALATRMILSQEGLGCDTFGTSELWAALRAGVDGKLLSVNGSAKDQALVDAAVEAGAKITLDSLAELSLVLAAAARTGVQVRIRFRVRPDYGDLSEPSDFFEEEVSIDRATRDYKAGIPTEDLLRLDPALLEARGIQLAGVMTHFPRHTASLETWEGMVRAYVAMIARLSEAWGGWSPSEVDIGGGFPTRRDPTGRLLHRLRDRADFAPPIEAYADVITESLRREMTQRGLPTHGVTLEVEPGRSLYADAGIHLASVRNVKRETVPKPRTWIEVDSSEAFLPDSIIEHNRWQVLAASRADEDAGVEADIVGISCGFDVMAPGARLPAVQMGDVVAFLDTGAYQDAGASNFNAMPRPATVLVSGSEAEVIKRRETVADVFARDVVPTRLDPAAFERVVTLDDHTGDAAAVHVKGINHISVTSGNVDRSIWFYGTVLGLPLRGRGETDSPELSTLVGLPEVALRWAEFELGAGRVLELLEYVSPEGRPLTQRTCDPGSGHFALEVENVDAVFDRLVEMGVEARSEPVLIEDEGYWFGSRCIYAVDPDGFTVEFVEPPP